MKLAVISLLGVVALVASPTAAARIAVAPARGDVDQTILVELDHRARTTIEVLGGEQATAAEVRQAIVALGDRAPSTNDEYAALGRELGVPIVMTITASRTGDEVTLVVRGICSRTADSTSQLSTVAADALLPAVGVLVEALLASIPAGWAEPPAPALAAREEPARIEESKPRQYESDVTEYAIEDQHRWRPGRGCDRIDYRPFVIFAGGAGLQGAGLVFLLLGGAIAAAVEEDPENETYPPPFWEDDHRLAAVGGVYLALTAVGGATLATVIANTGACWRSNWGLLFFGAALGAGAAWGIGYGYLGSGSDNEHLSHLTLIALPIILPALGELFGYLASRLPAEKLRDEPSPGERVRYSPPLPTVVVAQDGSGRMLPGITFGRLTF